MNKKKMSISLNSLLLFGDIVILDCSGKILSILIREEIYRMIKKEMARPKVANKLIKKCYQQRWHYVPRIL